MLDETVNVKNIQISDEEIYGFIRHLHEAKANINRKRKMAYTGNFIGIYERYDSAPVL